MPQGLHRSVTCHTRRAYEPLPANYVDVATRVVDGATILTSMERVDGPFIIERWIFDTNDVHGLTVVGEDYDARYNRGFIVVMNTHTALLWRLYFSARRLLMVAWYRIVRAVLRFLYWSTHTPRTIGVNATDKGRLHALLDHLNTRP